MSELKPCPFCGGEAQYTNLGCCVYIRCDACDFSMPTQRTEAEAIKAWNTRYERTCHVEGSYYDDLMDEDYSDLSCGHHLRGAAWEFDFCSKCGAKVVEE